MTTFKKIFLSLIIISNCVPLQADFYYTGPRAQQTANNYLFMNMGVKGLPLALAGIGLGVWAIYNNCKYIKPIQKKYVKLPKAQEMERLSTWGLSKWPTHLAIKNNEIAVIEAFMSQAEAKGLNLDDLMQTMENEITELDQDMDYLENNFATYGLPEIIPFIGGKRGVVKQYEKLTDTEDGHGEADWSKAQFAEINRSMKAYSKNRWYHYLMLRGNFGTGSYVWWKLKKLRMRLEQLHELILPISQDPTKRPEINRSRRVRDDHQRTRHDVRPV